MAEPMTYGHRKTASIINPSVYSVCVADREAIVTSVRYTHSTDERPVQQSRADSSLSVYIKLLSVIT